MTVEQKQTIRKTLSLMALCFAMTFAMVMMAGSIEFLNKPNSQSHQPSVVKLSHDIDTDWRYTKHGWQQMGELYHDSFAPLRTFESVHPFIWAATVMMAVVGTTLWASSEWEIARFGNQKQ